MKHSQVSRPFPACSQSRTQSPGTFWSAGESPVRQWMPLSPKHRVPVLVRILEIRTEMRDCLVMRIKSVEEGLISMLVIVKEPGFFFSQIEGVSCQCSIVTQATNQKILFDSIIPESLRVLTS